MFLGVTLDGRAVSSPAPGCHPEVRAQFPVSTWCRQCSTPPCSRAAPARCFPRPKSVLQPAQRAGLVKSSCTEKGKKNLNQRLNPLLDDSRVNCRGSGKSCHGKNGRADPLSSSSPDLFTSSISSVCYLDVAAFRGRIAWWTDHEVGTRRSRNESPALGVQTEWRKVFTYVFRFKIYFWYILQPGQRGSVRSREKEAIFKKKKKAHYFWTQH